MNSVTTVLVVVALMGTSVIGGVFFAFSSFVMKALARVPTGEGIAAMQSINVVVINPLFLTIFIGTAFLSAAVIALTVFGTSHAHSMYFVSGAFLYFVGTFLVTMFGNVPLNNQLATLSAAKLTSMEFWTHYLDRWTMWNHVRSVAAIGATFLFSLGLLQSGG